MKTTNTRSYDGAGRSKRKKGAVAPAGFVARDAQAAPLLQFGVSDLKTRCLEIISNVAETGASCVITKHGEPVARIVPYEQKAEPLEGCFAGEVTIKGDIVHCDFTDDWEAAK